MSWKIILQDERGEEIDSIDQFYSSKVFDEKHKKEFFLLKYLDEYGDTYFNWIQMDDVIRDLNLLLSLEENNLKNLIKKIISLA